MAQAGFTPIQLYFSTTAAAVPTSGNLANGELAINITDGKLYYKNNSGVVTLLAGATAGPAGGSNTQVQFNSSGVLAGSSNMTFNGTTLTVNDLTDSSLTAGRVTYAGASGNLVDSANLTFSGSALAVTGSFSATTTIAAGGAIKSTGANLVNEASAIKISQEGVSTSSIFAYGTNASTPGVLQLVTKSSDGSVQAVSGSFAYASGLTITHPNATAYSSTNGATWTNGLFLYNNATPATGVANFVQFGGASNVNNAFGAVQNASGYGDFVWAGYNGSFTEFGRFTSAGNFGIGTSSPVEKLTVTGAVAVTGGITGHGADRTTLSQEGANGAFWQSYGANTSTYGRFVMRQASSDFSLARSVVVIETTGFVGLGTTPTTPLDVYRGSSGVVLNLEGVNAYNAETGIAMSSGRAKISGFLESSGGTPGSILRFYTMPNGGSVTERMSITSNGSVEIGTATAQGRALNVNSAVDGYTMSLVQTSAATSGSNSGVVFAGYYDGSSITDMASIRGGKENATSGNFGGKLTFFTRTNGGSDTERVRITSSGQALFGLTGSAAPASASTVIYANGNSASLGIIGARNGSGRNTIAVIGDSNFECGYIGTSSAAGTNALFEVNGTNGVRFTVSASEGARVTSTRFFKADNSGTYYSAAGLFHEFRTNSDGNYVALLSSSASSPFGLGVFYSTSPNNTTNRFLDCEDSGGVRFQARSNGGLANYSANDVNLSDRREKTNFAPAGSYLDKICAIPVQTFNYIDQNLEQDGGLTLGVVAQDVQAVAPELVLESNWAGKDETPKMRLSIYQTDLQYALMKALQELKAEFDAYKASHP